MKNKRTESTSAGQLRRLAEERLREKPVDADQVQTEADLRRLQHELEVHQIELEMQNEELLRAQAETRAALEKYTDLYDFAPTGYFSLACDGTILAVNLTGARLVGIERARLINRRFAELILEADRRAFHSFLQKTFTEDGRETCEVRLRREGGAPLIIHIEAVLSNDSRECRAAVQDVTERVVINEKMRKYNALLRIMIARSAEPMMFVDDTGTIFCVSEKAASMLAYSVDELEGVPITRFLYAPDRLEFALRYEDLKKIRRRPVTATVRVYTTPPNWRWVSVTVTLEDGLQGSDIYLVKFEVPDNPVVGN